MEFQHLNATLSFYEIMEQDSTTTLKKTSHILEKQPSAKKTSLKNIAASTLQAIDEGSFTLEDITYDLRDAIEDANQRTTLYSADCDLAEWSSNSPSVDGDKGSLTGMEIQVLECSVLAGARDLKDILISLGLEQKVGVLNFASAKNPGGGFQKGAQAQEESIARSSTIYPSLMTQTAQPFFRSHKKNPNKGYYSHSMLYIPRVQFFRSDKGDWLPPVEVDIVSSCAVNAGVVRRYLGEKNSTDESELNAAMKERMGRVLYLFERQGIRNLVLGSFGTGVFKNEVGVVARIWKELLVSADARFKHSFDRVVFAILGNATFKIFEQTFSGEGENVAVEGASIVEEEGTVDSEDG